MHADILVFGTGSLARAFCYSMAIFNVGERAVIKVVGRSKKSAEQIAIISNVRAVIAHSKIRFVFDDIDWETTERIENILKNTSPAIIFHTASLQSPWDFFSIQSEWTKLVHQAGFGVTLPLQASLVMKVASAIKKLGLKAVLVNACYPDAVNPLLKSLELDITCGIGNISILSAAVSFLVHNNRTESLKILAHHLHVNPQPSISPNYREPRIWVESNELQSVGEMLQPIRGIHGHELNQITGATAVKIILALYDTTPILLHVPGPNGLPGGYPVLIANKKVSLSLPMGISEEQAILWNKCCAKYDGVVINNDGLAHFSHKASEILLKYGFKYAHRFNCKHLDSVCKEFLILKQKLNSVYQRRI